MQQERNVNLSYQYGTHQVCWYMHTDRWMRDWNDGDQMAHFFFYSPVACDKQKDAPPCITCFAILIKFGLKL